jgi:antitoxin component of RelBE/YafQ-DinJ toxin-antitoxin module
MERRSVRVDAQVWQAAMSAARNKGENLPDAIRAFLARYAKSATRTTTEEQ